MVKESLFISVVILNYNGKGFVEDCVSSVLESDYDNLEVIVADNASTDDSVIFVENISLHDKRLKVIKNEKNLFYSGGNNAGIKESKGEIVIILNNDTIVDKNWLKEISVAMQDESIGAAQPKVLIHGRMPPIIDYAGCGLDRYGYAIGFGAREKDEGQFDGIGEIFYAAGTAMILRRSVLDQVGLFDEKFFAHWEDVDLSWRIRLAGYKVSAIPKAIVYHKGSMTMKKFQGRKDVAWHVRKNRVAGLIKNYGALYLIRRLPVLLIIYHLVFIKEIIFDRDLGVAMSSFAAIAWNIRELPYILMQRKMVQNNIRRLPDKQIDKYMEKGFIAFKCLKESCAHE